MEGRGEAIGSVSEDRNKEQKDRPGGLEDLPHHSSIGSLSILRRPTYIGTNSPSSTELVLVPTTRYRFAATVAVLEHYRHCRQPDDAVADWPSADTSIVRRWAATAHACPMTTRCTAYNGIRTTAGQQGRQAGNSP